jgi:hypothetical protein
MGAERFSGNMMKGHLLTTHSSGPTWLSGGSAGPEGSLMVLPLLALMAIWIMFAVSENLVRKLKTLQGAVRCRRKIRRNWEADSMSERILISGASVAGPA